MRVFFGLAILFSCSTVCAWVGYYPGWMPNYYGGMGYGSFNNGMNSMSVIQTPSFNYNTTIVQSPPIIINQSGDLIKIPDRMQEFDKDQSYQSGR